MPFTKLFCTMPEDEKMHEQLLEVIDTIVKTVAENCGRDTSVRFADDDHAVAFGGTAESPELCLKFEWQKCFGKPALVAMLDDKYMWQEWDFGTKENLTRQIVKFLTEKLK